MGCSSNQMFQNTTCIPENDTSNYAPNIQRTEWGAKSSVPAMPPWWEPQLDKIHQSQVERFSGYDIAFRGNVMWIVYTATTREKTIMRYDMDTKEISTYGIRDKAGNIYRALNVFVTSDGILWARGTSSQDYSVLARFKDEKDEFQVVIDQDELLTPPIERDTSWIFPTQPVFGEIGDGNLVMALNGEIYHYDPTTNQVRLLLERERGENVNTIVVSEARQIWFTTHSDLSIRTLNPEDGTIRNYGPPPGIVLDGPDYYYDFIKPIEIDRHERIWVLDYGWLEPDENGQYTWQPIERSTVFIRIDDPEYEYVWMRPKLLYQFSVENMWYSNGIGGGGISIVEYDVEANKWCWKATKSGPLAEDASGNLWLVTGSQIYKYMLHR